MSDAARTAFEEGRMAATNAEKPAACPYEDGTPEHAAWREGYAYVADTGKLGEPND